MDAQATKPQQMSDRMVHHTGLMLQDAGLIQELKNRAGESQKYQRQIMEAREIERKALARELHDQVVQQLVSFRYEIADIQARLSLDQLKPNVNSQVDQLQEMIQGLIQTTRIICQNLRPPSLDLGLIAGIRALAHNIELTANLPICLTISGEQEVLIDEDVILCLHRCIQEALINAHRHAKSQEAAVHIEIVAGKVQVTIEDDGCGFAVPERLGSLMQHNHFGLVGMRERVEMLKGTLNIMSTPHSGTRVHIEIPR